MKSLPLPFLAASLCAVLLGAIGPTLMSLQPKSVEPSWVALAPWAGLLVGALAARLGPAPVARALAGLVGGALGGAALSTLGLAVAAERQNYWDAWHFTSVFWAGAAAAGLGTVLLTRARRESAAASLLLVPALGLVLVFVVLGSWMSFSVVQDLEGAIARWAWHLTHG